jgi:hypothetical protein
MLKPLLIVPGAVNAAVIVTESGELENFTHPTVVAVPRPNESAAMAEWVLYNKTPAKRADSRRGHAQPEAGRVRLARFRPPIGIFMLADPFWFKLEFVIFILSSPLLNASGSRQLLLSGDVVDFQFAELHTYHFRRRDTFVGE